VKKISIIGNGFVGNAIYEGIKDYYKTFSYDKDQSKRINTLLECSQSDFFFICVPTPSSYAGEFDLSYVKSAMSMLKSDKIIIIKSTITPEAAQELVDSFPNYRVVFNPEFLTERTAVEDFKNQRRIVLGGNKKDTEEVKRMYQKIFPDCEYILTDHKTSCFIKYFCNCFFACKVSMMNEFYQIAEKENICWDTSLKGLLLSGWVNPMHTLVPGPDGYLGFGGKCFPKDVLAFESYAKKIGVDPKILSASWKKNLEVRDDKNWEDIEGAVKKLDKL